MAYREPSLRVEQNFASVSSGAPAPLHATIVGPAFAVHRFAIEAEKARIGNYDRTVSSSTVPYPRTRGGIPEIGSAKLILDQGRLRYANVSSAGTLTATNGNRLRTATHSEVIFVSSPAAERSGIFGTRDVRVGDKVRLSYTESSVGKTFESEVVGFAAEVVLGSAQSETFASGKHFGSTTLDESNLTTPPTAYTAVADPTGYVGLVDGYPSDVYTITVLTVGTGNTSGGSLDGTVLRMLSDGGDSGDVTLGTSNWNISNTQYEVPMGLRGAVLLLESAGSGTVSAGNSWRVQVSQAYTEINPANNAQFNLSGSYTNTKATQYIITVAAGGVVGTDNLSFLVRTSNNADTSVTVNAPAADFASLADKTYAFGVNGMSLKIVKTTQFCTGDVILVNVSASTGGAVKTLILRDTVPAQASTVLTLELYVAGQYVFPDAYVDFAADAITYNGNLEITSTLLGASASYPVFGGVLYADYRELLNAIAGDKFMLASDGEIEDTLGTITPANPAAYAASLALASGGGTPVVVMCVEDETVQGYSDALERLETFRDVHGIVPLTLDPAVKAHAAAHAVSMSSPENNRWRVAWVGSNANPIKPVYVERSVGVDLEATVVENSPSMFNLLNLSIGTLMTADVRAGDQVRINFSTDVDGVVSYDTYTVQDVLSETTLLLRTSLPGAITVALKVEFHRVLTNVQFAQAVAAESSAYNHRRVYNVYADDAQHADGSAMATYFVAAAEAGKRAGSAPHAPLSRTGTVGVYLGSGRKITRSQYNTMAAGGTWIVHKDEEGAVVTRHQLSTIANPDDFLQREQSKTSNIDHISRDFWTLCKDIYGQSNGSPALISMLTARINDKIQEISARVYPAKIGPQMLGAKLMAIGIDPTYRDALNIEIDPAMPDPINNETIKFSIK